ncbi:MAG TPA: HTH domain-containing protein [Ktedonobacteraceae bacterium]|nr:HTH domain-containing protein [Ktedonobacteraceae bacterium]
MRADRLLSLLLLLQTRGRMTAQALAEYLEVSERTIYRDIEALSFAGIPLYSEHGPGGGYELLDGYQTRLNGLTIQEVRALFLLSISTPLADLGLDQTLEDAFLKLSAALPAPSREQAAQVRQRIYMDTAQPAHSGRVISHLGCIQEAIWNDCTLRLTYQGYYRRFFDPYGLVSRHGTWYLVGASAGMIHVVHVAHIRAAELTERHFTRPAEFDLVTYWAKHAVPIKRDPAGDRRSPVQKKARIKTAVSAHMLPRRSIHTARAQKKKKHFSFWPASHLDLPTAPGIYRFLNSLDIGRHVVVI